MEGFTDNLFKCLGILYFFHTEFKTRIKNKSQDLKYYAAKSAPSLGNQPYPAIFSVKSFSNADERIEITFQNVIITDEEPKANFKSCVYLVKTSGGQDAVLKLAYNYDIVSHSELSHENMKLAPKILGHEKICDRYHIILMEYLNPSLYKTIFNHIETDNRKPEPTINRDDLLLKLQSILTKLKASDLCIVHGDFRSGNIFAKISDNDPSILDDFKLIDFEFSGKENVPYPCLGTRNPEINWPSSFNSYMPRLFEHDQIMLEQMNINELKLKNNKEN